MPPQTHLKYLTILAAAASLTATPAAGLLAVSAQAVPITVAFSGTVNIAGTALTPAIVVGSPITGSYTFDSNAVNTSANPADTGDYAVTSFTATVGGFTFSPTTSLIFVEVNTGEYSVSGAGTGSVNGHGLDVFGLSTHSQAITTTALPLTPPPPLPLAVYTLELSFGLPPAEGVVDGTISSIAVVNSADIPEPATLILLTTAMAGLAGKRLVRRGTSLV
jgi:PEP-CTERM motif